MAFPMLSYTPNPYAGGKQDILNNAAAAGLGTYSDMNGYGQGKLLEGIIQNANQREQNKYSLLNSLMSAGYMDDKTRQQALGRFNSVLGNLGGARGNAQALADNGGYSPEEWAKILGEVGNVRGRYNTLADRGGLTENEYAQILAATRQDTMAAGKNAAEAAFNRGGQNVSPFGGAAVMAQAIADTGRNLASSRAELDKYQSDTRITGMEGLLALLNQERQLHADRATNKAAGSKLLAELLGIESGVAGQMANIDSKAMPDYVKSEIKNVKSGSGSPGAPVVPAGLGYIPRGK